MQHPAAIRARHAAVVTATLALTGALLVGCVAGPVSAPEEGGPGGAGIVTAAPEVTGVEVTEATACALVSENPTLQALGATGTEVDVSFVVELSMCQLEIPLGDSVLSSVSVGVVTANDVALTASADPTISNTTLVALPELGENGHFIGNVPGVDPASNPRHGAIVAARGDLGVSISWATTESAIPFATFEQIVRELLDELP